MNNHTLLVISPPAARQLRLLAQLPDETHIVTGETLEALEHAAPDATVLVCNGGHREILQQLWPSLRRLQWIHSLAAGLEGLLFTELVESPTPLTNSAGVYARSISEFALAGMLHFAKDIRRFLRQQASHEWTQFDVEELYGRTLGIVGFGGIGRLTAERARAFGMKIHVLRRRPELAGGDPLVDRNYTAAELPDLLAASDYLLVAAPLTPETRGLIGAAQISLMKPSAVILNFGRGPVIDEPALIDALRSRRIRAAVLDVFDVEPLPAGHPFYDMDNVLLSPHTADHTATWLDESMQFFVDNYTRFLRGEPLANVVNKRAGY